LNRPKPDGFNAFFKEHVMIRMKRPSLAINAHDVPRPWYKMWTTVNAIPGFTTYAAVGQILHANKVAVDQLGAPLQNVVINCHGKDGGGALYIGGEDMKYWDGRINRESAYYFSLLKPFNIGTLWLVACQAAAGEAGKNLCQMIATYSGCQVVAADEDQSTGVWGTIRLVTGLAENIDEYEGTVYRFTPAGSYSEIDPHEAIYTILE
jgi:hypothetical protein